MQTTCQRNPFTEGNSQDFQAGCTRSDCKATPAPRPYSRSCAIRIWRTRKTRPRLLAEFSLRKGLFHNMRPVLLLIVAVFCLPSADHGGFAVFGVGKEFQMKLMIDETFVGIHFESFRIIIHIEAFGASVEFATRHAKIDALALHVFYASCRKLPTSCRTV